MSLCKNTKERVAAWKSLSAQLDTCFPPTDEPPSLAKITETLREEKANMFACAILRPLGQTCTFEGDFEIPSVQLVIAKLETKDESPWALVLLENIPDQETSNDVKSSNSSLTMVTAPTKYSIETLLALQESPLSQVAPAEFAVIAAQNNLWAKTFEKDRDINWIKLQTLQRDVRTNDPPTRRSTHSPGEGTTERPSRERTHRPQRSLSDASYHHRTSEQENISPDQRHITFRTSNRPLESTHRSVGHIRPPASPSNGTPGFRRPSSANNASGSNSMLSSIQILEYEFAVQKENLVSAKEGQVLLLDRLSTTPAPVQTEKPLASQIGEIADASQVSGGSPALEMELNWGAGSDSVDAPSEKKDGNASSAAHVADDEIGLTDTTVRSKSPEAADFQPDMTFKSDKPKKQKEIRSLAEVPKASELVKETEPHGEPSAGEVNNDQELAHIEVQIAEKPAQEIDEEPARIELQFVETPDDAEVPRDEEPVLIELDFEAKHFDAHVELKFVDGKVQVDGEPDSQVKSVGKSARDEEKYDKGPVDLEIKLDGKLPHSEVKYDEIEVVVPAADAREVKTAAGEAVAQSAQVNTESTKPSSALQTTANAKTEKIILNPPLDSNLVKQYEISSLQRMTPYAKNSNWNRHGNQGGYSPPDRQKHPGYGVYPVAKPTYNSPSKFGGPGQMRPAAVPAFKNNWAIEIVGADDD